MKNILIITPLEKGKMRECYKELPEHLACKVTPIGFMGEMLQSVGKEKGETYPFYMYALSAGELMDPKDFNIIMGISHKKYQYNKIIAFYPEKIKAIEAFLPNDTLKEFYTLSDCTIMCNSIEELIHACN